jgi:hypothetical protein
VGDGQELGELDRSGLRHGIGARADGGQQTGGRGRVQQVALAPFDHGGQHGARRVEVRHDVQLPLPLPDRVLRVREQALPAGTRVGAEQVDPAVLLERGVDEGLHLGLVGDVAGPMIAAELRRRGRHGVRRQIREHHRTCPLVQKRLRHGLADAAAAAGDHRDPVVEFHRCFPLWLTNDAMRERAPPVGTRRMLPQDRGAMSAQGAVRGGDAPQPRTATRIQPDASR